MALSGGDALLLARILAGDDQALAAVYDQHVGVVYGLARRVARDEQLACDITQEVFTYLWEMPHPARPRVPPAHAWSIACRPR